MATCPTRRWRFFRLSLVLCGSFVGALSCPGDTAAQERLVGEAKVVGRAPLPDFDDDETDIDQVPLPLREASTPEKQAAPRLDPAPAAANAVAAAPVKPITESPALVWALPPTPWRGQLNLSASQQFPTSVSSMVQGFTASASTYVWQPWFIKLNGSLSISHGDASGAGSSSSSDAYALGGGGSFLPATRYPFSFTGALSKSGGKSRSDTSPAIASEAETTALGLNQQYTPFDGAYSTVWAYNLVNVKSTSSGDAQPFSATSQSLAGSLGIPVRSENPQSLNFNTNISSSANSQAGAGAGAFSGSVNGAHSVYLEDYVMTLSTDVMLNSTDVNTASEKNTSSVVQIGTSMAWVPSDDYPLSIGGAVRFFGSQAGSGEAASTVSSRVVSASANYPLDKHWQMGGQFSGVHSTSKAASVENSSEAYSLTATTSWNGEGLKAKLKDWDYSLNYGSSLGAGYTSTKNSQGAVAASSYSLGLSLGQALTRAFSVPGGKPVSLSLFESYGTASPFDTHSLGHGISASWAAAPSPDFTMDFNGSADDSRTFGQTEQVFQRISVSASSNAAMGPYSTLGAQANLAYSIQGGAASASRGVGSGSAGLSYTHQRFANISGLLYQVRYDLLLREKVSSSSSGASSSAGWDLGHAFSQSWSWRLGLIGLKLDHSMNVGPAGEVSHSINFAVVRDFSGML